MQTPVPSFPKTTSFDHLDGEGNFDAMKDLSYAESWGTIDSHTLACTRYARLCPLFGPGETRPKEHGEGIFVWRFFHNGIYYRLTASHDGPHRKFTTIFVEDPEIPTFEGVTLVQEKVKEFVGTFLDYVGNAPSSTAQG